MRDGLLRIAGVSPSSAIPAPRFGPAVAFSPLAVPFLVLVCEPRWEMAAAAACWSVLVLPGVLAVNRWFALDHPLGRGASRFAVASVLGLLPFGLLSWIGCLAHMRLSTVLWAFATLYVAAIIGLIRVLAKPAPATRADGGPDDAAGSVLGVSAPAWTKVAVIVGVAVMLLGVALATRRADNSADSESAGVGPQWWHGTLTAVIGSTVAGIGAFVGRRRSAVPPSKAAASTSHDRADFGPPGIAAAILWLAALGLTLFVMKASYALPHADYRRDAWNSDDVVYVSEAVDYRYGAPLGKFEPTLGAGLPMSPVNLSPLIAPLVASLSRMTGIGCAALHHSVLCPLIVLLGASALAAALHVVFRGHRWTVPLGLVVALLLICKSWQYERSMVEFTVWRSMQSKSVHLWLIHPLQLATLMLLATRPTGRHLLAAAAVAIVGHLVHPFSSILGAVWTGVMLAYSAAAGIWDRRGPEAEASGGNGRSAAPWFLIAMLTGYGALGVAYKVQGRLLLPTVVDAAAWPSSGRVADEPEETRDLVRIEGLPIHRQEPGILFGADTLFTFGAASLPLLAAVGLRRRELLLVAIIGVVTLALCNIAILGRWLSVALPTSILWRARWMLPSLVCIAAVGGLLWEAVRGLASRPSGRLGSVWALAASIAAISGIVWTLAASESRQVRIGPPPRQLSKFSADMEGLVTLLGGVEAAPFVWGPREVTRELPQLMPHLKLALSREKIMLPTAYPNFRDKVLDIRDHFRRGTLSQTDFRLLLKMHPIDHVVLEKLPKRVDPAIKLLIEAGWKDAGVSGRYHVWRKYDRP